MSRYARVFAQPPSRKAPAGEAASPVSTVAAKAGSARPTVLACLCAIACMLTAVLPSTAGAAELGATQFGSHGTGAGQFRNPEGVAVNDDMSSLLFGDVYVVDPGDQRIARFDGS
jgi:hypothetical protein